MILDLSKDGKFVVVSAFTTPANVDPSQIFGDLRAAIAQADVQFFDGERIAGKEHLEIATINALHAFKAGINISRSAAMEVLLRASAQRQIDVAISRLGVTRNTKTVAFVALSDTRDGVGILENRIAQLVGTTMNDALLDDWSAEKMIRIMKIYEIEPVELEAIGMPNHDAEEAVKKAVIERIALLSTRT